MEPLVNDQPCGELVVGRAGWVYPEHRAVAAMIAAPGVDLRGQPVRGRAGLRAVAVRPELEQRPLRAGRPYHVGGVRWWNLKHPARYAAALATGCSPAAGREVLSASERYTEQVMLGLRLADGLPLDVPGRAAAQRAITDGLLTAIPAGRLMLTHRGRLLADAVVRDLLAPQSRSDKRHYDNMAPNNSVDTVGR